MAIDPATGVVSGTPTFAVAEFDVDITATDANDDAVTTTVTWNILPEDPGIPMGHPLVAGGALALLAAGAFAVRFRRSGTVA